ncbi:lytic transglycosylase domain-containing protein [Pacificimonas sp. ICDLI1SI03]
MSTPARLLTTAGIGAMLASGSLAATSQNEEPTPVAATTAETNQTPPPQAAAAAAALPAELIVARWERLLDARATPSLGEYTAFLRDYPNFPDELGVRQRAETAMTASTPIAERLAFFAVSEPSTAAGRFRYAEALRQSGRGEEAIAMAREAWRSGYLDRDTRSEFLARFGSDMRPEDHAQRVDMMLWREDLDGAANMISLLGTDDRVLTSARIALQRGAKSDGNVEAAYAAIANVPEGLKQHPGFIEDLYQFYRANSQSGQARALLAKTRIAPGSAADPDRWMKAHLSAAQSAVADRQYQLAYEISAHHGGLSFATPLLDNNGAERDTFTSLEWLAGWTALHDLNRPADAIRHFQNFSNAANFAATRSRGLYWAGRAAEAAGRADANAFFEEAAKYELTFYGQLAHEKLGRPLQIAAGDTPTPSPQTVSAWNADPRVRAVQIYGQQNESGKQQQFLSALAGTLTREQLPLYAQLARQWGHGRYAILNSRGADSTGPDAVVDISWRTIDLPRQTEGQWTMIHAITRQESQFEVDAVSPAGARGLMQLMRPTAQETAGKIGLPYRPEALTSDGAYNIQLGSAYFANLVDYWAGSHVLAIASYNAGPGNVRKWIGEHGDPRMSGVDVLEWIEEIPFYETKTYVRNVLENAVIYDQIQPQMRRGGPQEARLSWYLGKNDRG